MIRFAFIGDISFNDEYNHLYEQGQNPFSKIETVLENCDFVIGNLECISAGSEGENELKKPRLKTRNKTLNYLKNIRISAVTLAHNHIYDNLFDGFNKTISFLGSNQIDYLGAGKDDEIASKPLFIEKQGMKFCFLSFVHNDTNPSLPKDCPVYLNFYGKDKIVHSIKKYKAENYIVILLLHWGGRFEGGLYPDKYQSVHARDFVQSGADLIIGHHSHTFQPYEKIDDKYVFYSLGNFCFSDIITEGNLRKMSDSRSRKSAIVLVDFNKNNYTVKLHPIVNRKLYLHHRPVFRIRIFCRNLFFYFAQRIQFLWKVYYFWFKMIRPVVKGIFRIDKNRSILTRIREFRFSKFTHHLKN